MRAALGLSLFLSCIAGATAAREEPVPGGTPAAPRARAAPQPTRGAADAPVGVTGPAPAQPEPGEELRQAREELAAIRAELDRLMSGASPPAWAAAQHQDLVRSLDRLIEMEERLAARIETPLPRLDEPLILFSVAGSTLVLGFVLGGRVQRRRSRRDGRLRL